MPGEVFVDTGVWYAAQNLKDINHEASAAAMQEAAEERLRPVTTNLVIAEAHALLVSRLHRAAGVSFLRRVRGAQVTVVASTPEREDRAVREWIDRYEDQDFSFADGVSFAVMTERGNEEVVHLDNNVVDSGHNVRPEQTGPPGSCSDCGNFWLVF